VILSQVSCDNYIVSNFTQEGKKDMKMGNYRELLGGHIGSFSGSNPKHYYDILDKISQCNTMSDIANQPITNFTQSDFSTIVLKEYQRHAGKTRSGKYPVTLIQIEKTGDGFNALYKVSGSNIWEMYTKHKNFYSIDSYIKKEARKILDDNFSVTGINIRKGSLLVGIDIAGICTIIQTIIAVVSFGITLYDRFKAKNEEKFTVIRECDIPDEILREINRKGKVIKVDWG